MTEYSSGVRGFIRICANVSAITQFLHQDMRSFLDKYPNVQIHLSEKTSTEIIKSVKNNIADIGVFSNSYSYSTSEVQVLHYRRDKLTLIVPSGHPLLKRYYTFSDALNYDFIGMHKGGNINHVLSNAANGIMHDLRMKVQVHTTGFDTLCTMVNSNLGVGVLPTSVAKLYSRIFDIKLIPIEEDWAERKIDICVRSRESLPKAAQLFIDHLSTSESK